MRTNDDPTNFLHELNSGLQSAIVKCFRASILNVFLCKFCEDCLLTLFLFFSFPRASKRT